jgi:hypothetical protein
MKNQPCFLICFMTLLAVVWLAAPAWAQINYDVDPVLSTDGTAVPDVDKPNPADQSCWLAAAANVLAAAGWGPAGLNAQARAMSIYNNDLMTHFGNGAWLGWSSVAINWWLLNHGYNPNSTQYNHDLQYNNVTIITPAPGAPGFTMAQYDQILGELTNSQYVNVAFDPPSPGHEMTLVGGNYWNNSNFPNNPVSLWTDNNGDAIVGQNTEISPNLQAPISGEWRVNHRNIQPFYRPNIATILCPGLQKDDVMIKNYDVAYFKDMVADEHGNPILVNATRIAGANAQNYTGPNGMPDIEWGGSTEQPEVIIPNLPMPDPWYKEIELLVDYVDRNVLVANPNLANIVVKVGAIIYNPDWVKWTADQGQALFHWTLDDQPGWETIVFPDASYQTLYDISTGLGGPVKDWNLATLCVPEPSTCLTLAFAIAMFIGYARFRRRQ